MVSGLPEGTEGPTILRATPLCISIGYRRVTGLRACPYYSTGSLLVYLKELKVREKLTAHYHEGSKVPRITAHYHEGP